MRRSQIATGVAVKRGFGLVLLFLLAAAYLRLGLFIPIEWMDEGALVYPIWRVAEGELPYRDFQHLYGPSFFFVNALLLRLFGSDLAVLRYFLLAVKAATCVMVYLGARRISGRAFACIAYVLSVVIAGLVFPVSSTPYASHFATALCLAGLLGFLASERRFLLGCAVAGLCFGLATTFKQTSGAFAFVALALFLLVDEGSWRSGSGATVGILVRTSRWFVLLFAAALSIFYLAPRNPFWNLLLLVTPILFLTGHLALRELRGGRDPESQLRSFWGMVTLSLAFLLPLAGYALLYRSLGLWDEIVFNTVSGIPAIVDWLSPYPRPTTTFVLWQLACFGGFASAAIWRRRSVETLRGRRFWTLGGLLASLSLLAFGALAVRGWQARTEPYWFWGSSDLLRSMPFVLVWLSIVAMVRHSSVDSPSGSPRQRRAFCLFTCYAAMALLWLFPAADIWHIVALLPSCLPLLACLLERFWKLPEADGRDPRTGRLVAGALIGVFGLALLLPAMHDLLQERSNEPAFAQSLPRATGVRGSYGDWGYTRNGGQVVRYLLEAEQRDEALFVLSAKSFFYFLTDRVSPMQEFEFTLYMTGLDLVREEQARELVDEDELIRRLREVRPLIVDDSYDHAGQNVRRMYPRFARFIRTHYRQEKEFGKFRVLRWDPQRARR